MTVEPAEAPDDAPNDGEDATDLAREDLLAQVELLQEQNRRLRAEYARARRAQYRRTAVGMAVLGVVAVLGGVAFPANRPVLFALGAVGLFGALLTYYLAPERFVAATVGEGVYAAVAETGDRLVSELGLADDRVYVPLDDPARRAVLFVPQNDTYDLPDAEDFDATFVAPDDDSRRGVAFHPTGAALFEEFERALAGPLADDPAPLADQVADGLVEAFELAESATPEVDAEGSSARVAVAGSALGDVDRFDHPVASFAGVGFAIGLDRPVAVEVVPAEDRADHLVVCSWGEGEDGRAVATERDERTVPPEREPIEE